MIGVIYMDDWDAYSCYCFHQGKSKRIKICDSFDEAREAFFGYYLNMAGRIKKHVWTLFALSKRDHELKRM